MGVINVYGSGFSGLFIGQNGHKKIVVTKIDLIHAAITYGYRNWHEVKFSEAARRVITVLSALEVSNVTSLFEQSSLYKQCDASEKTYTSYVIGMVLSKIIANKLLGFNWLMHYDMFTKLPGVTFTRTSTNNKKPDFISTKSPTEWLVMEAKGRTSNFDINPILVGKQQVNTVLSINSITPLRVVSESYFNPSLNVEYVDPETEEGDIFTTEESNLHKYYYEVLHVLFNSITEAESVNLDDFIFKGTIISGTEYYVGIPLDIYNYIEHSEELFYYISKLREKLHNRPGVFICDDGVMIMDKSEYSVK